MMTVVNDHAEAPDADVLRALGIFVPSTLVEQSKRQTANRDLVSGLIRLGSLNMLVGDSNLGKTPLAIQLGACIASGTPFLGMNVRRGRVLYCDAESDLQRFLDTLGAISRHLGLPEPPEDFHTWSPLWDTGTEDDESEWGDRLLARVEAVKPLLVIADPLRMFWPAAETKNHEAATVVSALRNASRAVGTAWLVLHHRRKQNQAVAGASLEENAHQWFQESAGAFALVNQSDSRLGVEPGKGTSDLLLGGYVRGTGPFPALNLSRAIDTDGEPVGYRLLTGIEQLRPEDRATFDKLPQTFRFKDVEAALGGTSASNANRVIQKFIALNAAAKHGKAYTKTTGAE